MSAPSILFLDLDGTVRHGYDELGHFVNTVHDVVIFPEVHDRIRAWRKRGGVIVGITNQGGVALGYMTEQVHRSICAETQAQARLDRVLSCIHAPDADCWCRKPAPGMLLAAAWAFDHPPRSACFMVGDRPEDERAAAAAGVPFAWAADWRATS